MVAPFNIDAHLGDVQRWAIQQGVEPPAPDILPAVGLMVPDVAAGWLYQTDSRVGFLEYFLTNPLAPLVARHTAISAIAVELIAKAKALGLARVVSMTSHRSIGRISMRLGFSYIGPMHLLRLEV